MRVCSSISSASKYDGDNFYREFIRNYILVCYVTISLEVLVRVSECTYVHMYLHGLSSEVDELSRCQQKPLCLGCFRLSYPKTG